MTLVLSTISVKLNQIIFRLRIRCDLWYERYPSIFLFVLEIVGSFDLGEYSVALVRLWNVLWHWDESSVVSYSRWSMRWSLIKRILETRDKRRKVIFWSARWDRKARWQRFSRLLCRLRSCSWNDTRRECGATRPVSREI